MRAMKAFLSSLGIGLCASVAVAGCSGDSETSKGGNANNSGDASADGSSGGSSGNGGSGGTPVGVPTSITCGTNTCNEYSNAALSGFIGALPPCCLSDNSCGAETSGLSSLAGGAPVPTGDAGLPACMAQSELATMFGDGGLFGNIQDEVVTLDANCDGSVALTGLAAMALAGCCSPEGECGGDTTALAAQATGFGIAVPTACVTKVELTQILSSNPLFGGFVTVAGQDMGPCGDGGSNPSDAGAVDSGTD